MFDTIPISHLASMLSYFAFPMLVAERPDPRTQFRMVAMNAALENVIGPMDTVSGRALQDVLPPEVMSEINAYFDTNDAQQMTQKIRCTICTMAGQTPCDLTLQYLRCADGFDRVVATAQELRAYDLDINDKLAFEDICYFSFIADLQLENLNSAFASTTDFVREAQIDEERILRLHAVCRTVQRTVSDIKNIVKQAQARHAVQGSAFTDGDRTAVTQPALQNDDNMFEVLSQHSEDRFA